MDVQELIERSIYEKIRLALVSEGLTPDIVTNNTDTLYNAALQAIETSKGFSVELFGSSSVESKGERKYARVVLDWVLFTEGDIGTTPEVVYTKQEDGSFSKTVNHISSYEGLLAVAVVCNNIQEVRAINSILRENLPSKSYVPYYTGSGNFLILQESSVKVSQTNDPLQEWVYTYLIPDIFFGLDIAKTGEVTEITSITIETELSNHLGISEEVLVYEEERVFDQTFDNTFE